MLILYFYFPLAQKPFSMDIRQTTLSQVLTDAKKANGTY